MNDGRARQAAVQAAMNVLRQTPVFVGLGDVRLRLVAEHARPTTFGDGETIYHEDGASDSMFVLESGTVDIRNGDKVVATLTGVDTVGEVGVVLGGPRMAAVSTRTLVSGYIISREGLAAAFLCDAELEWRVMRNIIMVLADRLGAVNRKVAKLQAKLAEAPVSG